MAYTILLNKIRVGSKQPRLYKGSTEVKCAYKGSTLVYDCQKSTSNSNVFQVSYASNYMPWTPGYVTPTITKGYNTTATGYSGATYNKGFTSVTSTVTFTKGTTTSDPKEGTGWATLNTSTGRVDHTRNREPAVRTVQVKASCTINGTSMTSDNVLSQNTCGYSLTIRMYNNNGGYGGYFFLSNQSSVPSTNFNPSSGYMYPFQAGSVKVFGLSEYPSFVLLDYWGSPVPEPIQPQIIYLWYYKENTGTGNPTCVQKANVYWSNTGNSLTMDLVI